MMTRIDDDDDGDEDEDLTPRPHLRVFKILKVPQQKKSD